MLGGNYIATTRFIALHTGKGRNMSSAISKIIGYMENPAKTDNGSLISYYECNAHMIDAEFSLAQRIYQTKSGREPRQNDVIAYQIRQSFKPGEIAPEEANRLGYELTMRFTKGQHAFIVCTHIDKAHCHSHIIFNSVTLDCTRKFRDFLGSGKAVGRLSDTICIENGYSVITEPKKHQGLSYNKWQERQGIADKPSHREVLRQAIDRALTQQPADFNELLKLLEQAGIEVSQRGKNWRLKSAGWQNFARLDKLGEGYSEAELRAVIASKEMPKPKSKPTEKINLLVDIQQKLAEGKGVGYSRWASVFAKHSAPPFPLKNGGDCNRKQLAKTYNYLNENNLLSYDELVAKTAVATQKYDELLGRIKAAESRMAKIAELKTHIINYHKTREIFAAYKRSGYSKKFAAEHESALLLHRTAKKYFDSLGLKKLPTVKSLQAEYAKLLAEKKAAYSEYRRVKKDKQELLTVKMNVDNLLKVDDSKGKNIQREAEKER